MKPKPNIILPVLALAVAAAVYMDASPLEATRRQMAALADEAGKVINAAKDGLSADDAARVEAIHAQIEGLRKTEAILEKQAGFDAHLKTLPPDEQRKAALAQRGISAKEGDELEKFSFLNVVRAQLRGSQPLSGLEAEMIQEGRHEVIAAGGNIASEGYHIPSVVLAAITASRFRNDVTVGGSGTGAEVVFREPLQGIIDPFYAAQKTRQLGARLLSGLTGNLPFPKMGRDSTKPAAASETGSSQEITATTAVVTLTPHRVPAHFEVSQQFLRQTSPAVEAWLRDNLLMEIAEVLEKYALHGSGLSNQPTGVAATSGIGSVAGGTDGAAPDWADIIDLETAVANANADAGSLAYLTNSKVRGKLKKTLITATYGDQHIWDRRTPEAPLNGYRAEVSNCVSSTLTKGTSSGVASAIFFGNWTDLVFGQWGGLDVLVNPYSLDTTGLVRITAAAFADSAVLRAESFAAMLDALTA